MLNRLAGINVVEAEMVFWNMDKIKVPSFFGSGFVVVKDSFCVSSIVALVAYLDDFLLPRSFVQSANAVFG